MNVSELEWLWCRAFGPLDVPHEMKSSLLYIPMDLVYSFRVLQSVQTIPAATTPGSQQRQLLMSTVGGTYKVQQL